MPSSLNILNLTLIAVLVAAALSVMGADVGTGAGTAQAIALVR